MTCERIKSVRKDHGWSQQQMANRLHISRSAYAAYESGRTACPPAILIQLSQLYNTSIDFLLGRTDDPTPYD